MGRVKVHALCLRPLNECDCGPDDDEVDAQTDRPAGEAESR